MPPNIAGNSSPTAIEPSALATPQPHPSPGAISIHSRYISAFESNLVRVDLTGQNSLKPAIREFDLAAVTLNLTVGTYPLRRIVPLTNFPEWTTAIKAAINKALPRPGRDVSQYIGQTVWACVRIAIWFIRQGHYSPNTITSNELLELARRLCNENWHGLLQTSRALEEFIEQAEKDRSLYTSILGDNLGHRKTINPEKLSLLIGIPIWIVETPRWFRSKVFAALSHTTEELGTDDWLRPSASGSRQVYKAVRALSLSVPTAPGLQSVPLTELNKIFEDRFGEERESTVNVTPEQAIAIFQECLKWLYTYSHGVREALQLYREIAEGAVASGKYKISAELDDARESFLQILTTFEISGFEHFGAITQILAALVNTLFCAIGALCATLNGRRINEIVGYCVKYGFYFGCLVTDGVAHSLDSWLQKQGGRRGWRFFPACEMVSDCVTLLEEFDNLMQGLNTPPQERVSGANTSRSPKLFRIRDFRTNVLEPAKTMHDWRENCDLLLNRIGLDRSLLSGKSPPFRRLHITIYKFRFEYAELLSLNHQIGQMRVDHLKPYYSDAVGRAEEDKLVHLWRKSISDDIDFFSDVASQELLALYVRRFLSGEKVGGRFPLVIAAVSRRLIKHVRFVQGSLADRTELVTAGLVRKGYRGNEGPEGPCMLGRSRVARHHAKCGGDVERKSPEVCSGCLNNSTSNSTMSIYAAEVEMLEAREKDFRLPPAARAQARTALEDMRALVKLEQEFSTANQEAYTKVFMMIPVEFRNG